MAKQTNKTAAAPVTENLVPEGSETTSSMEPVQLTIADLQLLSRIVDLASRRGAFQAGELSQVGDAYNKVSSFLAYVESVQTKEKAEADADTAATAE